MLAHSGSLSWFLKKWFNDFNRQSRSHSGSFFLLEMSFTISSDNQIGAVSALNLKSKPHL